MSTNLHKHIPLGQKPIPNNKNAKKMQDLKNAFLKEYKNNKCNISAACKKLGITRGTFYDWEKSDENFKVAVNEAIEGLYDSVEDKLQECINNMDTTAIIFFCKTKMKQRGYVEKQQLDLSGNVNHTILTIDPFAAGDKPEKDEK